jgi:hypothetical protein
VAPTACFVSASRQNVFFGELLDALADALAGHGIAVERTVDFFPEPRAGLAYVFVPHELLPLLMEDAHPRAEQLRRSVTICTEQPGTHWFEEAAQAAEQAARAVDINRVGVSALRKRGVDARFLQLGYTRRWDRWGGARESERPIDVTFLAGATPRRLTAVARCARQLAGRRTELHLPQALVPHRADSQHFISGGRKWELLAQSKLLLNVHRGELGYFEWQRAVEAICNGCVLLSEHSRGFEPLVPGEHFFSVSLDSLDVALEGLLHDEPRLARVRERAYAFLREQHPLAESVTVLAEAIAEAASAPGPASESARRQLGLGPRPKPPQLPPPAWELALQADETDGARRALARLALGQRELRESIGAIEGVARSADRDGADLDDAGRVEQLGVTRSTAPRVSVLLTVCEQGSTVARAIELLAIGELDDLELVIVDDGSTDGSGNRIRVALARVPWLATTLLTRRRRGGLAHARNLGLARAAGELVLVLDGRDAPYPHALARLLDTLDRAPAAAFAYGIVEQEGVSGQSSLAGYLGWDADVLRYGNFVGTMPLLRRRSLLEAGGYPTDPALEGWEDLALWCAFAERGWSGAHLSEIVGCRHAGLEAATERAGDPSAAWATLLDRFGCLSASVAA